MSIKKGIGYSPLSDKIYLGKQNKEKGLWVGDKEDITSDFLTVLNQYIPKDTSRNMVLKNTNENSVIIHIDMEEESIRNTLKFLNTRLIEIIQETNEKL